MKALLVVDVQNDFCPGGALGVTGGDRIVPVINALMDKFPLVIASKDWHPHETVHFQKWPVHCVHNSRGAEFHPDLRSVKIKQVFLKGTKNVDDGYSAFEATSADLASYLKERGVTDLYLVGLATDYCVRATTLDAMNLGFHAFVVEDAVAAVDVHPGDGAQALAEMRAAGVKIVQAKDVSNG